MVDHNTRAKINGHAYGLPRPNQAFPTMFRMRIDKVLSANIGYYSRTTLGSIDL